MIITVLIGAIVLLSVIQWTPQRLIAALSVSIAMIVHDLAFGELSGIAYFGSAALLDALALICTTGIVPAPKFVVLIQRVLIASVALNFIGWGLWFFYVSSVFYHSAFIVLYLFVIYVLTRSYDDDRGGFATGCWYSCFRFNHNPMYIKLFKGKAQ